MPSLTRPPSNEMPHLTRRLSIEETYALADTARRKSSSQSTRKDLRLQLAHSNVLEHLLHDIAMNESALAKSPESSPPTSPTQCHSLPKHIVWAAAEVVKTARYPSADGGAEEFDDGAEDLEGLSLCKTSSRRPTR